MNKKFLSAILFGALMVTSTGTFVSCKDYDDDIENLQGQIDNLATKSDVEAKLSQLQAALDAAKAESSANAADIAALEKEVASMMAKVEAAIEAEIKAMPGYFAPYKTTVNFVSQEELNSKYTGFPHDGCVVAASTTGNGNSATVEYRCTWASNPEATANVLVAHARAAVRMNKAGESGAKTILDIPPKMLSPLSYEELLKKFM